MVNFRLEVQKWKINIDMFAGKSKEQEVKRINKELANIRSKFKGMYCSVCVCVYGKAPA